MLREKNIPYEEVIRLEDKLPELDVLYMTRVQKERFFKDVYKRQPQKHLKALLHKSDIHPP